MPSSDEKDKYLQNIKASGFGLMAPLLGTLPKLAGSTSKNDFKALINRSEFLNNNSIFDEVDPVLKNAYTKEGKYGLLDKYEDMFSKHIPIGQSYVPADISNAGKFLKQKIKDNRSSILTVTPEAQSRRFDSGDVDAGVGGGSSATLWGNPEIPQYGYARGNLGVKEVIGSNPSAQFSAVELPPEDKREYLRTTDVIKEGAEKRGWGQFNNEKDGDMHFGKEYRKAGGLTTANDIYTYLSNKGIKVSTPTGRPDVDLAELTEKLSESLGKNPYDALESIASPAPTWGSSERNLGQLPTLTAYDFSNENASKAGLGSFFKEADPHDVAHMKVKPLYTKVPFNNKSQIAFSDVLEQFKDGQYQKGIGDRLSKVGIGGLAGTAFTSTDIAKDVRQGDYAEAGTKAGAAYATGELASSLFNAGVKKATEAGITWAPKAAANFGKLVGPVAGLEAIDTASTLATGKNSREIVTQANNTGPAIAAITAPMTMAPLGLAGGPSHMQGYQRNRLTAEQTRANQAALGERARLARKRGPNALLPELGISEWMGINGQELAPEPYARGAGLNDLKSKTPQKVMAVLNGEEGYMLQGDPASFRIANWSPLDRRRYYAGGATSDID